jgi:hypothetical protein
VTSSSMWPDRKSLARPLERLGGRADTAVAGEVAGAGQWMPENNYTEV